MQVLLLLQADVATRVSQAAAAAGPGPAGEPPSAAPAPAPAAASSSAAAVAVEQEPVVFADQLQLEMEDLKAEMAVAQRDKKVLEEQYLAQIIAVSWAGLAQVRWPHASAPGNAICADQSEGWQPVCSLLFTCKNNSGLCKPFTKAVAGGAAHSIAVISSCCSKMLKPSEHDSTCYVVMLPCYHYSLFLCNVCRLLRCAIGICA